MNELYNVMLCLCKKYNLTYRELLAALARCFGQTEAKQ